MSISYNSIEVRAIQESPKNRRGEKYFTNPKLYVDIENESIFENLQNRRNRPYSEYKKEILPLAMQVLERENPEVYQKLKDAKWGWRQDCGCSMCPCSPGFVATNIIGFETITVILK